jgi:hypothetical protein
MSEREVDGVGESNVPEGDQDANGSVGASRLGGFSLA